MPYVVTCPKCKTKLKSNDPVPAGRDVTCLKCKTIFTLIKPAPELEVPAKAAPSADRVDRPARTRDEDDDGPKTRRSDDDDDRPPSKRRRDDEDDVPPRGKRRRDEDDDDDRPRSRKRAADDEDDDDRPPPRRGRDDDDEPPAYRNKRRRDDDDDDRPRSRTGAKKSRKGLFIILGAAAALLLFLCGGGAVAVWYFDPFGLFGGASSEMLAWAPSDSQTLMYMDVEGMEKNDTMKGLFKDEAVNQVKLGLKREDVSAMLGAGRATGDPEVTVIKLRAKADQQKLIAACGGKEATANGKKYYKSSGGGGLYFASDKLLVVTKTDSAMAAVLQKENKVTIHDDLKAVSNKGEGVFWMAASGPAASAVDPIGGMSVAGRMVGGGIPNPAALKPPPAKSTLMCWKVSSSRGTLRYESTYDSPETAKKIADDLKRGIEPAKSKSKDVESVDVSSSGPTVTLTLVTSSINKPGLPFGPMGP